MQSDKGSFAEISSKNSIRSQALVGPKKIFQRYIQLMKGAKSDIFLQTWLLEDESEMGRLLLTGLKNLKTQLQKEKRSLKLWFIINNTQVNSGTNDHYEREFIRALKKYGLLEGPLQINYMIFKARFLGAFHAKSLVVDRDVAIIPGANFSHKNDGVGLYDVGLELRGEVVDSILEDFIWQWNLYLPSNPINFQHLNKPTRQGSDCLPVLFASNHPNNRAAGGSIKKSLNGAILQMIREAKSTIEILTPNLNNRDVIEEILNAIERGVRVKILLSYAFEDFSQSLLTRGGTNLTKVNQMYRQFDLYRKRTQVCQDFQVRWYSQNGKTPSVGSEPGNSHAKYMVVDNRLTYFGSLNFDNQSFYNSREIGVIFDNRNLSKKIKAQVFNSKFKLGFLAKQCSRTYGVTDEDYYKY